MYLSICSLWTYVDRLIEPINYEQNIVFKATVTKCFHRIETSMSGGTMKLTQRQAKYIPIINS
jgi:hypothetical protein